MTNFINNHPEAVFGLLGTLVGALISSTIPWFQSLYLTKKERARNAKYLAIRVVSILERYSNDCSNVVSDDGTIYGQPSEADGSCHPQVKTPGHITYPEDLDWRSIDHDLMYDLLSLPNMAEFADRAIDASVEHSSPPDYSEIFEERQSQYATLGLQTLDLEEKIRKQFGIKKTNSSEWDIRKHFLDSINSIKETREKRAISSQKLFEDLENGQGIRKNL